MTAIETPCIMLCSIDDTTGYCFGCGRTRDGVSLVPQVAAVPEPSNWAMMLLGFIGTGAAAYRRRKNAVATATA